MNKENWYIMNWGELVTWLQAGKYSSHFFLQADFLVNSKSWFRNPKSVVFDLISPAVCHSQEHFQSLRLGEVGTGWEQEDTYTLLDASPSSTAEGLAELCLGPYRVQEIFFVFFQMETIVYLSVTPFLVSWKGIFFFFPPGGPYFCL